MLKYGLLQKAALALYFNKWIGTEYTKRKMIYTHCLSQISVGQKEINKSKQTNKLQTTLFLHKPCYFAERLILIQTVRDFSWINAFLLMLPGMGDTLKPKFTQIQLGHTRLDSQLPWINHLPEMSHKATERVFCFWFFFFVIFFLKDSTDRK